MNYVEPLTEREWEVLTLVAQGYTNREIAADLVIEVTTVQNHMRSILGKFGVKSRIQAVLTAYKLIPRDQEMSWGKAQTAKTKVHAVVSLPH